MAELSPQDQFLHLDNGSSRRWTRRFLYPRRVALMLVRANHPPEKRMLRVVLAALFLSPCLHAAPIPPAPPLKPDPMAKVYYGFAAGMCDKDGVTVFRMYPGSPVEKAGIREDDFLVTVAGVYIKTWADLRKVQYESQYRPGAVVEVVVKRDGKLMFFKVCLGGCHLP